MSTCNRLDLQTLGSQPIMPNQKSPQSLIPSTKQGKKWSRSRVELADMEI